MNNFITLIKSSRFQQLLIIALLQTLVVFHIINGDEGTGLINILSGLFAASVVVRTVDKHGESGAPIPGNTTVSIPADTTVTASTE